MGLQVTRLLRHEFWSRRGLDWLAIALIAFGAAWLRTPAFPEDNNVFHIPIVLDYAASAEGPHDAFHYSLKHFVSFFWLALSGITNEDNIRRTFIIFHSVTVVLTVMGAYAIALAAETPKKIAVAGIGMLAFAFVSRKEMSLGGGELLAHYLTHSQLAIALCLFSLALAVRERWLWAALVVGLSSNINFFLSCWLTLNLILARAMIGTRLSGHLPWRDCLIIGIISLVTALPTIIWIIWVFFDTRGPVPEFSFTEFLYSYYPYHSFFHLQIGPSIAFLSLSTAVCVISAKEISSAKPLVVLMVAAVSTVLISCVLPYLLDSRWIQNLYPLRYVGVVHWLTALLVIQLCAREARSWPSAIFGATAALGFMLPNPAVTLFGLLLMIDWKHRPKWQWRISLLCLWMSLISNAIPLIRTVPEKAFAETQTLPSIEYLGPNPVITYICAISAILLTIHPIRTLRWSYAILIWGIASTTLIADRTVLTISLLVSACLSTLVASGGAEKNRRPSLILVATAALFMALYLHAIGVARVGVGSLIISAAVLATSEAVDAIRAFAFYKKQLTAWTLLGVCIVSLSAFGIARSVRYSLDVPSDEYDGDFFAAQEWARRNTAPDTVFYEPEDRGFAVFSRRPVWWSWKQGAAVMWDPLFYSVWHERQLQATSAKTVEELAVLAHKQRIQFLVLPRERLNSPPPGELIERYCNRHYCIFQVT